MIYNANASWNYRIAAHQFGVDRIECWPWHTEKEILQNAEQRTKSQAAYNSCPCWPSCCKGGVARGACTGRRYGYGSVNLMTLTLALKGWSNTLWGYTTGQSSNNRLIETTDSQSIESINRYTFVHAPRLHKLTPLAFHFQFRFWFRFRFQFLSFILRLYEKPVFIANNMICKSRGSANFTYYLFNWLYQLSMQPLTTCIWI